MGAAKHQGAISAVAKACCVSVTLLTFLTACSRNETAAPETPQARTTHCSYEQATPSADGITRLALLVGVGSYQDSSITRLAGPPGDVAKMHELLAGSGGYGFPERNVCELVDAEATGQKFREAFQKALIARATKGALIVIYFAGHGTQIADDNDDEPDGLDEALMLVDSRQTALGTLRDDEIFQLLESARTASGNVLMIVDACTSGSATRGTDSPAGLVTRFQPPRPQDMPAARRGVPVVADQSESWIPQSRPGLVVMAAAVDGTSAVESGGAGAFTTALVRVLSEASATPVTYAQVASRVPPLLSARSDQVPAFEGGEDKIVFGAATRNRPAALVVRSTAPAIKLGGTLMPGVGPGAELRLYDSGLFGPDLQEPAKSKAILIVDSASGPNAVAHIVSQPPNAPPPRAGDLAVMLRPSNDTVTLRVRIRPDKERDGVPAARAKALFKAIQSNRDVVNRIELTDSLQDFELASDYLGRITIIGPEGQVRDAAMEDEDIVEDLRLHARQRAFLNLRSEPGGQFKDDDTLQVKIEQNGERSPCSPKGVQIARDSSGTWVLPLCMHWKMTVSLAPDVATPLQVGGLVLSSDGSIYGFPAPDQERIILHHGDHKSPTLVEATATIPIGTTDYVLVFGTKESNPVDWYRLTQAARSRGPADAANPLGPLYRAIESYLGDGGLRGQIVQSTRFEDSAWTRTVASLRVAANPTFEPQTTEVADPGSREYTIKDFDIRPYLPDSPKTPLYRLLREAQRMTAHGYSYHQHDWPKTRTDEQNLANGIDCTRAIWYAFRKAGLQYNKGDDYLSTAQMVGAGSRMSEMFDQCPANEAPQIGDVLVYRDEKQGDGHAVVVIDPPKRIAWGSHGWDGNAKKFNVEPEKGVEYQLIKTSPDWQRWDRRAMQLSACWRYRPFKEARARGQGLPGTAALESPCDPAYCDLITRPTR